MGNEVSNANIAPSVCFCCRTGRTPDATDATAAAVVDESTQCRDDLTKSAAKSPVNDVEVANDTLPEEKLEGTAKGS
jgi:hypothetical protein